MPVGVKQTMRNPATHAELQLQRSVQGSVHMSRTRQSPVDCAQGKFRYRTGDALLLLLLLAYTAPTRYASLLIFATNETTSS
jgi:hypothetical protein